MSGTDSLITAAEFRDGMVAAGAKIDAERDTLSALDAAAGDGDLGATLGAGFTYVHDALLALPDGDVGALLKEAGVTLARKAPSTFGALLGSAFLRCSQQFVGVTELTAGDVARLMVALTQAVSERGGAVPGQRTVVDALDGGATAATAAASSGRTAVEALAAAASGAREAADRTAGMEAKFGRAAWVAERARGERDAGAVAWSIYLSGLSAAVSAVSREAGV